MTTCRNDASSGKRFSYGRRLLIALLLISTTSVAVAVYLVLRTAKNALADRQLPSGLIVSKIDYDMHQIVTSSRSTVVFPRKQDSWMIVRQIDEVNGFVYGECYLRPWNGSAGTVWFLIEVDGLVVEEFATRTQWHAALSREGLASPPTLRSDTSFPTVEHP